ncbi:MAG: hypothetical protein ABSE99_05135 [Terracidiphilus sp.]|jgi:hypothetical protein
MADRARKLYRQLQDEASRQFIDAWHRAGRGETFYERPLAFESWDALARFLTGKLMGPFCSLRRMLARR